MRDPFILQILGIIQNADVKYTYARTKNIISILYIKWRQDMLTLLPYSFVVQCSIYSLFKSFSQLNALEKRYYYYCPCIYHSFYRSCWRSSSELRCLEINAVFLWSDNKSNKISLPIMYSHYFTTYTTVPFYCGNLWDQPNRYARTRTKKSFFGEKKKEIRNNTSNTLIAQLLLTVDVLPPLWCKIMLWWQQGKKDEGNSGSACSLTTSLYFYRHGEDCLLRNFYSSC